ncbi:hypothetical protein BOTBODRAFT_58595 [Botryobasidium botryosum FD-172 SS1]|uniref:Enoyl reductase (ER) domain-containing protein n=1 Tax=Botryobasidium botryosum (strain FD-172 SS1) TaxID=930990 RepID=A0A067MCB0_BOTB1|nr:hypothetical protein BOTBODRAFT_58595 [Botryobasidium botryosum FD-172 SS1]
MYTSQQKEFRKSSFFSPVSSLVQEQYIMAAVKKYKASVSDVILIYPSNTAPFKIGTRPIPSPEDDQLLVKVMSAALNPCDVLAQQAFLAVLGIDIAGLVGKTGTKLGEFFVGDKVFFQGHFFDSSQTGYQQHTVVLSELVSYIPSNLSFDQDSSIPLTFVIAFVGLFHSTRLQIAPPFAGPAVTAANVIILVIGGSSIVGSSPSNSQPSLKRILTTVASKHNSTVKAVGAIHVFDRAAADLEEQIRVATTDELVYIYDAVSSEDMQDLSWKLLPDTKPRTLVLIRDSVQTDASPKKTQNRSGHWHRGVSVLLWKAIGKWLEEGVVVPPKMTVLGGLAAVPKGVQRRREGKVSGGS